VLDGSPRDSRGKGCFWHGFQHCSAFSSNTLQWRHMDTLTYWSIIDSRVKNWQYFCTHGIPLNFISNSLSFDVVRFKIEVGVDAKCMYKNVTLNAHELPAVAAA